MPIIIDTLGIGVALIGIAALLIIGLIVTIAWAPETTNVSIDEI